MANTVTVSLEKIVKVLKKNKNWPFHQSSAIGVLEAAFTDPVSQTFLDYEINVEYEKITGTSTTGSTGGGTAVDPKDPMEKIARALSNAESVLNEQNLVITNALVEMDMKVDGGNGADASTTVKFGIEPQSSH
jgi:hypothetical protein